MILKAIPETCENDCNHPITKPYTKAMNDKKTNGLTTLLLNTFKKLFQKTAIKNANEINEVMTAIPTTVLLESSPLDHSDNAKPKYRVPRETGLTRLIPLTSVFWFSVT
jgi:hypothetical protein